MKLIQFKKEGIYNYLIFLGKKYRIGKDFSLESGERLTDTKLENIRLDHLERYKCCAKILEREYGKNDKIMGLDFFCGIGYGSFYISNELGNAFIDAYDGSSDAIRVGKKHYKTKNIKYKVRKFPCKLKNNFYDFIISIESIEHIKNEKKFVKNLVMALKPGGILLLSSPNEEKFSLKVNRILHHYRHHTISEFSKLIEANSLEILEYYGHDTYIMDEKGKIAKENGNKLFTNDYVMKKNYNGQNLVFVCKKK